MPFAFRCLAALTAAVVLAAAARSAPAAAEQYRHPLTNARLAPELRAAAERDHVRITPQNAVADSPAPGDTVVLWIGATKDQSSDQWLIQISRAAATPEELALHRGREVKKYLSWGPVVDFRSDVDALDLWIAGPIDVSHGISADSKATAPAPVRRTRVFVPRDYLRLGLDNSERVDVFIRTRTAEIRKEDAGFAGGHIYAMDHPIKPAKVAVAKPVADRIGFTPEMERAWIGGYVALRAFYDVANEVPELRDIANIAFQKPAFWELAKVVNGTTFITSFGGPKSRPVDPARLGLLPCGFESFEVPFSFSFGREPISTGAMIVTSPEPPLDVCAGILGAIAVHPTDPARVVQIAAISAHRGAARLGKDDPRSAEAFAERTQKPKQN